MLVITGCDVLSDFRQKKLLQSLRAVVSVCASFKAHFLYFVDSDQPLRLGQREILRQLLEGDELDIHSPWDNDVSPANCGSQSYRHSFITVPRLGTISPWSTKATDIVHRCGLTQVNRVERGIKWDVEFTAENKGDTSLVEEVLHDPMTESVLAEIEAASILFDVSDPASLFVIDLLDGGLSALNAANREFGFALSDEEQEYLLSQFTELGRNPTDVELMMFAQVNSEHCRHKIFNADWTIDGQPQSSSLFSMVRTTHESHGAGTLTAYNDNAAVLTGSDSSRFAPHSEDHVYGFTDEPIHFTIKVETHNHPTAISPFPGASTGSGGEIRDEGAAGRGGKPKAGLIGYAVSHLRIPQFPQPWEHEEAKPSRIASPLQIMLDGPLGAAAFNNEFGRAAIVGYFRTFEHQANGSDNRLIHGYHKPIMLAGGLGTIREQHIRKNQIADGTPIVVLGGPTMLIGLGGGAASGVASGESAELLDFASVQRGNPEMQRRCQEVIDACCGMGTDNPIVSIHDVGAGGVCNALPELVHDADRGGVFELRNILNDEPGMSPMQIWCNESQERYVLAVNPSQFELFESICRRERCLYAHVGNAVKDNKLVLTDTYFSSTSNHPDDEDVSQSIKPIDLPMDLLFGLPPKMHRDVVSVKPVLNPLDFDGVSVAKATERVLSFPTVADKSFLVTIGDRSVSGLVVRDQMVGPWQVPVADVGVTASGYAGYTGEAMAIGERPPVALIDAMASGRMSVGEAITNIAAAPIESLSKVRLSANWMVAAGEAGQDADLYATVRSVTLDLCPKLGVSIPVGKDSMSMKSVWRSEEIEHKAVSPLSLVTSAFAAVTDVRRTLTPQLQLDQGDTDLWLIDLGAGKNRMGGSILAQVTSQIGESAPNVDDANQLKGLFEFIQRINLEGLILAYHDRSDGGMMTTLCEMAFAARCGLDIDLSELSGDYLDVLFNEELGAVIQTRSADRSEVEKWMASFDLLELCHRIGKPKQGDRLNFRTNGSVIYDESRIVCHRTWSQVSWQMQTMRDNPLCAKQEYDRLLDDSDPGLFAKLTFDVRQQSMVNVRAAKPRIAILREQGVNGQLEMAAAFDAVGFEAVDVTMSDLIHGDDLSSFKGMAACGGFSFGDVLGAGQGWGKSILYNSRLRDMFGEFFIRSDTFALGVCNGCQMMASIKTLIPGAQNWVNPKRNASEQYEARFVMVKVSSDQSILFKDMEGTMLPVSVAHGEGRMSFSDKHQFDIMKNSGQVSMQFVDNYGEDTQTFPFNPNGSASGVTGLTNDDGRFTIMMPHPERIFRTITNSWHPSGWEEQSPWAKIFHNARKWVD
ncbi:MAG: phosphoribosylformylglycinamidine synthase [Gammaproteobacteria bacterium]|nr:phosphoribosylformylglycinamidine synthase [Gammaproteobacteria bacterium]